MPQSTGLQRTGHNWSDHAHIDTSLFFFFFFLACGSFDPMRVEHGYGTVSQLMGKLQAPSMQGTGVPLPQELWHYQSFFPASCSWWWGVLFGQSFSIALLFRHLEGSLTWVTSLLFITLDTWMGPLDWILLGRSVCQGLKGEPWVGSIL